MDELISFSDSIERIEEREAVKAHEPDAHVLKLRERLLSSAYGDAMEARISILAEIVFRTYIHQLHLFSRHDQ